jgi:hypothetical protein
MKRRFRTMPAKGAAPQIDRAAGTIRGVSAIQAVEALGHDLLVDEVTLRQVAEHGTAAGKVKSRFTHPGLCSDGMGKMLGHAANFRVQGDKTLCDLTFIEAAAQSPDGDLRAYTLKLAEDAPGDFGLSIVFSGTPVWKLPDGSELPVNDPSLRRKEDGPFGDSYYARPDTATTTTPFARCEQLFAVDVVDEPAANRDGLFSAAFGATTSTLAEQAFAWLDEFRDLHGIGLDTIDAFTTRYRQARGAPASTHPHQLSNQPQESSMDPRLYRLSQLMPMFAALIIAMSTDKKPVDDIVDAVYAKAFTGMEDKVKALATERDSATAALAKAETDHKAALAAKDAELSAAKASIEKFQKFEQVGTGITDPGGDASSGASGGDAKAATKQAWASNPQLQAFFHKDFATFASAVELDGLDKVKAEVAKASA